MLKKTLFVGCALLIAGCVTSGVEVGGADSGPVSGSASAAGSQGSEQLARCPEPRATIVLELSQNQDRQVLIARELPPDPLPAMRLIAQQTNCFQIVHRLKTIETERRLQQAGELSSNRFGRGQMIAADHTLIVEVILSNPNKSGAGAMGALGGLFGPAGLLAGAVAGSVQHSEAGVVLTLVDNRTSLQLASTNGHAKGTSFGIGGMLGLGTGGIAALGGAGGYENTDQGKVVMGAMVHAMNNLVPLVRSNPRHSPPTASRPQGNDLVRGIQRELKGEGYQIAVDGLYGGQTKAVIMEYQKKHGLTENGEASEALLKHLRENSS